MLVGYCNKLQKLEDALAEQMLTSAKCAKLCKMSNIVQNMQKCAKCAKACNIVQFVQRCSKCADCAKCAKCSKFCKMCKVVQSVQCCAKYAKAVGLIGWGPTGESANQIVLTNANPLVFEQGFWGGREDF